MTQPILALVPTNTPSTSEYSAADRASFKEYQATLAAGGYYKLFNASSPFPRLISRDNLTDPLPLSWLVADYNDWLKETRSTTWPSKMPTDAYLARPLLSVVGTKFLPNGPALIRAKQSRHRYINTYKSFQSDHAPLELSPIFHEFMEALFPDPKELHIFTQYISHMLKYPEIRPSWHIMLLSETGTGKGFLYNDIIKPMLCNQSFLVSSYGRLTGKFSTIMESSLLIFLDDCKAKTESTQTDLKSLMTEETAYTEHKGLQGSMVTVYPRMILASNEAVPIALDDTSRRWWIPKRLGYSDGLTGKAGRANRQRLIARLSTWLKTSGAIEAIHAYLMSYTLEGFDPKLCPECDTLNEIIAKSETVDQGFAHDFLTNHPTKVVKTNELLQAFTDAGMNRPSNNSVRYLFDYCNYRTDTLCANGSRSRYWFPKHLTNDEAIKILEAPDKF